MTTIPARPDTPSTTPSGEPLGSALARLEARWGSAAVRLGNGGPIDGSSAASIAGDGPTALARAGAIGSREAMNTLGALALAPMPDLEPTSAPTPSPDHRSAPDPATEAVSTGFPALDELLGTGGLPRRAGATLRGDASSGKTTLALRSVAEAQAVGGIVAWLDGGRTFDPLEAAARGVDLRWLVVLRPAEVGEGLRLAGALVSGRAVDLLVLDLPPHLARANEALLRRLAAHARRIGVQLLVLEPIDLAAPLHGALAEAAGVRLELERIGWLRLGRDIVGQRTAVTVAKNRFGPPGRQVELEIRYLDDGERAAGVARLLDDGERAAGVPQLLDAVASPGREARWEREAGPGREARWEREAGPGREARWEREAGPGREARWEREGRLVSDAHPTGIRNDGTPESVAIRTIPRSETHAATALEGHDPSQHPSRGYMAKRGGSRATASAARATATGPPTQRRPHPRDPGSGRRPGPRPLHDEAVASPPPARHVQKPPTPLVTIDHAPPAPRLAQPPAPSRAGPPGPALDTDDAARPRRAAMGSGQRPRSQSRRGTLRRAAGAAAGGGPPARP